MINDRSREPRFIGFEPCSLFIKNEKFFIILPLLSKGLCYDVSRPSHYILAALRIILSFRAWFCGLLLEVRKRRFDGLVEAEEILEISEFLRI
jgi:hypothetical protein